MSEAKLTTKGQITIPKAVRERLNLEPGDRVSFVVQDDGSVVLRPRNLPWQRLRGIVKSPLNRPLTIEEMNPASDPNYDPGGLE